MNLTASIWTADGCSSISFLSVALLQLNTSYVSDCQADQAFDEKKKKSVWWMMSASATQKQWVWLSSVLQMFSRLPQSQAHRSTDGSPQAWPQAWSWAAEASRWPAALSVCLSVCQKASSRLMVTAWKVGCCSRGRSFSVCGHSKIRVEITTAPLKLLFLQSWGGELHMLLLKITWKLLFFLRIIFFSNVFHRKVWNVWMFQILFCMFFTSTFLECQIWSLWFSWGTSPRFQEIYRPWIVLPFRNGESTYT